MRRNDTKTFPQVVSEEEAEIARRRKQAFPGSDPATDEEGPLATAGLAISGGGIRSAAFGLGILQAFYKKGLLRQFDYLSTVSGGSYVGAFLSSSISNFRNKSAKINWTPIDSPLSKPDQPSAGNGSPSPSPSNGSNPSPKDQPSPTSKSKPASDFSRNAKGQTLANGLLPLLPATGEHRHPDLTRRMYGAQRLYRTFDFVSAAALGAFLISLTVFSATVATAALVAWLYRQLDLLSVQQAISELGFSGDVRLRLFPSFILLLVWLISFPVARFFSRAKDLPRYTFAALIVSLVLAAAAILMTDDISVPWLTSPDIQKSLSEWSGIAINLFLAGLAATLLPFFGLSSLLQSGQTRSPNRLQRWVFTLASTGLLYGVPLLIFGYLAKENVSGYNEIRPDRGDISPHNIVHKDRFLEQIERLAGPTSATSANSQQPVARVLQDAIAKHTRLSAPDIDQLNHSYAMMSQQNEQISNMLLLPVEYVASLPGSVIDATAYERRLQHRRRASHTYQIVTDAINRHVLANQDLERDVPKSLGIPKFDEATWRQRAQQLSQQVDAERQQIRDSDALRRIAQDHTLPPGLATELAAVAEPIGTRPSFPDLVTEVHQLPQALKASVRPTNADDLAEVERLSQELTTLLLDLKQHNFQLLNGAFPNELKPTETVFAAIVTPADQQYRLQIFAISAVIAVGLGLSLNLNAISCHTAFRSRIASLWINPSSRAGIAIPLRDLDTVGKGGPYHLILATAHFNGISDNPEHDILEGYLFSSRYCGTDETGYLSVDRCKGWGYDLANATAVSSAAINPMMTTNHFLKMLILLFNLRLGEWAPNPRYEQRLLSWPSPLRVWLESLLYSPGQREYLFLSDGGSCDNTALLPLLRRRCRFIVAVDATDDPNGDFACVMRTLQKANADHGIHVEIWPPQPDADRDDFEALRKVLPIIHKEGKRENAKQHFVFFRIDYGDSDGVLVLVRPSLTGDEPIALLGRFQELDGHFPQDPTVDQLFEPDQFEAYRSLGEHIGEKLFETILSSQGGGDRNAPWLADWEPKIPPDDAGGASDAQGDNGSIVSELELETVGAPGPASKHTFTNGHDSKNAPGSKKSKTKPSNSQKSSFTDEEGGTKKLRKPKPR